MIGTHKTTARGNGHDLLSVVYHSTEVVRLEGRAITLDTGGYKTVTTKARMNQASEQYALGFSVFQKAKKWFVRLANDDVVDFFENKITFKI